MSEAGSAADRGSHGEVDDETWGVIVAGATVRGLGDSTARMARRSRVRTLACPAQSVQLPPRNSAAVLPPLPPSHPLPSNASLSLENRLNTAIAMVVARWYRLLRPANCSAAYAASDAEPFHWWWCWRRRWLRRQVGRQGQGALAAVGAHRHHLNGLTWVSQAASRR